MPHAILFSIRSDIYERGSGAHRIATFLRQHDWDIEVIDFSSFWTFEQLQELVKSRATSKTKFFGFSTLFNFWPGHINDFTKWLKKEYPDTPTVIGGQAVGLVDAQNIDYWIDSYGEYAMLALVQKFAGTDTTPIKYDLTSGKKIIKALHSYPAYPMDRYSNFLEKRDFVESWEWLTIEFSRGCKFKCDFCNFPILGVKGDYSRTQEDFQKEMQYNHEMFGVKHYYVADETFNDRVGKIIKFADVVEALDFKPYFSGFIRADLAITKKDSWEHLARLNFGAQYYGVESFNHESGKAVGKGMHPDKVKDGLLDLKKYFSSKLDYRGTLSMILGLPYETEKSWLSTQDWLLSNWTDQNIILFLLEIPKLDSINSLSNSSEFSRNLFKYNLREMEASKLETEHKVWYDNWLRNEQTESLLKFPNLIWEHDTMNLPTATRLSKEFATHNHKFKWSNWDLHLAGFENPRQNLKESLQHSKTYRSNYDNKRAFVDTYIEKKLNWK